MSGRVGFQAMPPRHHRSADRWGSPGRVAGQSWTSTVPGMEEPSSALGRPTCLPWYSGRRDGALWASMFGSVTFPAVNGDLLCAEGREGSSGTLVVHAWKTARPTKDDGPTRVGRTVVTAWHIGDHSAEDQRSHVGSPECWTLNRRHPKDPLRDGLRTASRFYPWRCPLSPMEPCWGERGRPEPSFAVGAARTARGARFAATSHRPTPNEKGKVTSDTPVLDGNCHAVT
jgi:hypothetical protein